MIKKIMELNGMIKGIKDMDMVDLKELRNEIGIYLDGVSKDVKGMKSLEISFFKSVEGIEKGIIKEINDREKGEGKSSRGVSKKELILDLWDSGKGVKEISVELGILYNMVRNYIVNYRGVDELNDRKVKG